MKEKTDKRLAARAEKLRLEAKALRRKLNAMAREVRTASDKKLAQIVREEVKKENAFGSDFLSKITSILKAGAETIAEMRPKKINLQEKSYATHKEKISKN